MSKITLWYAPGVCSLASHILLHESGLPFEAVSVSLRDGEQTKPEFARLNPKKKVPVLAIDEDIITESPAIAVAVAGLVPEMALVGRPGIEQVRVIEWMNWISGTLHGTGFGAAFRPMRFSDDEAAFDGIRAKAKDTIAECFALIESRLDGSHAVGGRFTAVDSYLVPYYRWGLNLVFDMVRDYPRYTALIAAMIERPSAQAAFAAEGLDLPELREKIAG